ncbi:MAG: hypothetical protein IKS48_08190 [Eubacterium sp.]|nr:hypothetical protein [Eubacterium sp.]
MDEICKVEQLIEKLIGEEWEGERDSLPAGTEKWLEEQDLLNRGEELERRTAARILHMYMRAVLGIKDVEDITPAYELRDLFDCRVCANHIAQVYMRGVMDAVRIGELCIFDVHGKVTREKALSYVKKIDQVVKK